MCEWGLIALAQHPGQSSFNTLFVAHAGILGPPVETRPGRLTELIFSSVRVNYKLGHLLLL